MDKAAMGLGIFVAAILLFIGLTALIGLAVMYMWNLLVFKLCGGPEITYWEAVILAFAIDWIGKTISRK